MSNTEVHGRTFTINLEGMDRVERALGDLKAKTPAVAKTAINATAREARKLVSARAKARYAVNAAGAKHLKDIKQTRRATNSNLSTSLHIEKMRNDLGYFHNVPRKVFIGASVLNSAPAFVKANVLKSESPKPLTGKGNLSKAFLAYFSNGGKGRGHTGMVQRVIGSSSDKTEIASGKPRWRNSEGKVEKLQTLGSPSATAMLTKVWPDVQPEAEQYLLARLDLQVQKVIERAARRNGK